MNFPSIRCGILAAMIFPILAGVAQAEDARLPYAQLYRIQEVQTELSRSHTNLEVAVKMQSTLPEVKISDLKAYIDAKAGRIPVTFDAMGDFTLPMRPDLLDENPWIIVNQPRGTMKLDWQAGVVLGRMTNSIRYARLMRPVRECDDVQEQMRKVFPASPRLTMTGLKLIFVQNTPKAAVILHVRGGDRKLEAKDNGELLIPLSPDLLEEDPELWLTKIPDKVEIATRRSE